MELNDVSGVDSVVQSSAMELNDVSGVDSVVQSLNYSNPT